MVIVVVVGVMVVMMIVGWSYGDIDGNDGGSVDG